jgi:hypothetical protein
MEISPMASTRSKIKYSPQEQTLLRLLPTGKRISSMELDNQLYTTANRPFHSLKSVSATMTSLMKKLDYNKDKYMIIKGPRSGPKYMEYTKVERDVRSKNKAARSSN